LQTVIILKQLVRLRGLVIAAAVLAVLVGGLIALHPGLPPHSRSYTVGVASARVLIDTPSSQVVDLGLKEDANAGVLPARAVLLANLLTTSPLKDETARRAGVRSDQLVAMADTPTETGAPVQKPLATGASVSASDPKADVLTAHTDEALPLVTVNTRAPDAATATRLANAAVAVLQANVNSLSGNENIPAQRRVVVKPLGSARGGVEQRGPSPAIAILATILVFTLLCGALLLCAGIARQWHGAEAYADRDTEAYADEDAEWEDADFVDDAVPEYGADPAADGVVAVLPVHSRSTSTPADPEPRWDVR